MDDVMAELDPAIHSFGPAACPVQGVDTRGRPGDDDVLSGRAIPPSLRSAGMTEGGGYASESRYILPPRVK